MSPILSFIKFLLRGYQRRINGSHSAQIAYQVLQRGLRRWQESESLLSPRELSLIESCRNRLILSAAERALIEGSEEAMSRHWRRKTRRGIATASVVFGVIAGVFVLYFLAFRVGKEQAGIALSKEQKADVPALKINQPMRKDPLPREPAIAEVSPSELSKRPSAVDDAPPPPTPAPPAAAPTIKTMPAAVPKARAPKKAFVPKPAVPKRPAEEKITNTAPLIATSFGVVQILRQGGKVGIADAAGRFLLPPEYDDIQLFNRERGLFKIVKEGKEGLARAHGELLLHPFFEEVSDYINQEQLVVVANEGKYGLYDEKRRRFAGDLNFLNICCYSEGLFGVKRSNGRWGFVNREGKAIIFSMYEAIEQPFNNGRAVVRKDGQKVKIDRNGNVFPM